MEKMTIERFREICAFTQSVYAKVKDGTMDDLSITEAEALEEELVKSIELLRNSDLSGIPFEEWKDYVVFNEDFNLENTGANIDFNYLTIPEEMGTMRLEVRLKGCNVRNFTFDREKLGYSTESFDEAFVEDAMQEHPDAFPDSGIDDPEARARYDSKSLTLSDVKRFDLAGKIPLDYLDYKIRNIVHRIGWDKAVEIDDAILEDEHVVDLLGRAVYKIEESGQEYDFDKAKALMIDEVRGELASKYSFKRIYERFENIPFIRDGLPEYYIDFGENTELRERFLKQELTLEDIIANKELFEGKNILNAISATYSLRFDYEEITEEKLRYVLDREPEFTKFFLRQNPNMIMQAANDLDLTKPGEEISIELKGKALDYIKRHKDYIDFSDTEMYEYIDYKDLALDLVTDSYSRNYVERVLEDESVIGLLIESGLTPGDLASGEIAKFFDRYGTRRVLEFDRQNGGYFSENGFARAKLIDDAFFHYAGNVHDSRRTIFTKNYDLKTGEYVGGDDSKEYSEEHFDEAVRRMIVYGPTDWNYISRPLGHRHMKGKFRDSNPDLFVDESMPEEWQEKFYEGTVSFDEIRFMEDEEANLPYVQEILSKNRFLAFRRCPAKDSIITLPQDVLYQLIREVGNYAYKADIKDYDGLSSEEILTTIKDYIENEILRGSIEYGEKAPDYFKEKHPELFLLPEAPEELKIKYYKRYCEENGIQKSMQNGQLTINDLTTHLEYVDFLEGKDLSLANCDSKLVEFVKLFGDEAYELIQKDPEAIQIIGNSSVQSIKRFKELLDTRPEYYAIKELKEKDGYLDEEVELILSGEETQDEKILNGRKLLESKKDKFREYIISTPGYVIHCPDDKLDTFDFGEFKDLERLSKFDISDNYRRDTAEQIMVSMYAFLGYGASKEVLKLPEIDEAELEEAIRTTGVAVSGIYENMHTITGNLKIVGALFDKVNPALPGGKGTFAIYKSLNQALEEGFDGSIEELIAKVTRENGVNIKDDRIKSITKAAVAANVQEKLSLLAEPLDAYLGENVIETPENIKILRDVLNNTLKKTLSENEKLDLDRIRELITQEFSRLKPDGTTFYSPHVTDHLEDLMMFLGNMNANEDISKRLNMSVVDIVGAEKDKIGQGWIRKLGNLKQRMTEPELVALEQRLYGETGYRIPTEKTLELKDRSEEGIREAYTILKELELPGVFTFEKGEIMFAGLRQPYSENFREFFMANMTEILRKPEYYTLFQMMNARMDAVISQPDIKSRFQAGLYKVSELADDIKSVTYNNIEPGYYELAYRAKKSGLSQEEFDVAKKIYDQMKERERQSVPPVSHKGKRFVGRIVRIDDPLHLTIGNITTCCQRLGEGQPGESSMLHSALEENGSVFVVEEVDENGEVIQVVSQSWTWRNGDRVCFDNVEIPNTLHASLAARNAHQEIFEVYQEVAKRMIEVDKKVLDQFLADGKITKEQYDALVIKEVTIGGGCDDLLKYIPNIKRDDTTSRVAPLEAGKKYTGMNVDHRLYLDSYSQYSIAQNEDVVSLDHKTAPQDVRYGYTRIRDINRKKNTDIHFDLIQRVKDMNARAGEDVKAASILARQESNNMAAILRENYSAFYNKDVVLSFGECDDWYIFASENDNSITIEDSLLLPEGEDAEAAKAEYARELLGLARIASKKNKGLVIDSERDGKFINFDKLVEEGAISKSSSGIITVKDQEKLDMIIDGLDARIKEENEKRTVRNVSFGDKKDSEEKPSQDDEIR